MNPSLTLYNVHTTYVQYFQYLTTLFISNCIMAICLKFKRYHQHHGPQRRKMFKIDK